MVDITVWVVWDKEQRLIYKIFDDMELADKVSNFLNEKICSERFGIEGYPINDKINFDSVYVEKDAGLRRWKGLYKADPGQMYQGYCAQCGKTAYSKDVHVNESLKYCPHCGMRMSSFVQKDLR